MSLENLQVLAKVLADTTAIFDPSNKGFHVTSEAIYCPQCGDKRRVDIYVLKSEVTPTMAYKATAPIPATFSKDQANKLSAERWETYITSLVDTLAKYVCVQCEMIFTVLIYQGPYGPALAILPSKLGGLSTPHTPEGVQYYLDQAQKSSSVGANSAAISMFRAALENLLYEQGYQDGMLGRKLSDLEQTVAAGTAPKWALELETEFLQVLKDLGNASIHPNDGDISSQAQFDNELLELVKETFSHLLYIIYEVPHEQTSALGKLRARRELLKKRT